MNLPAIRKTAGDRVLLDLPALELTGGGIHAVLGANGCGKTTLARILAGTLAPDGGKNALPAGISVGYMPQKSVPFHMTVRRNLLFGGGNGAKADTLLSALDLNHLSEQNALRLSGGETARVALARVLMENRNLLILDEPTAAMDVSAALLAEQAILDYRARTGCTVLWVTHSVKQARRVADDVLFLDGGKLLERGTAEAVLEHPQQDKTRVFLDFYNL